jgi:hypothetical protein
MTDMSNDMPNDSQNESIARRRQMMMHLAEACRLAAIEGVPNLLRSPGLVQQVLVSEALGLVPCLSWRDGPGDAYAAADPTQRFEIFTAIEGRRFQARAAGMSGKNSRDDLRKRFLEAAKIYLAIFDVREPLKLLRVYEAAPATMWQKAAIRTDGSGGERAYISISERWAAENGRCVIPRTPDKGVHQRT